MLDLSTAVLCDFAQVRDRLLFVSSGAVSRLYRQELPSPLGLMVGLVIEVPLEDAGMEHRLRAEVINRHGTVLATLDNTFRVSDAGLFPHEVQQVPLVLSITGVRARTWGTHQVRLYLDDDLVRALTLYVVPAAVPQTAVRAEPTQSRVADDEGTAGMPPEPAADEPEGEPAPAAESVLWGAPAEPAAPVEPEPAEAPSPTEEPELDLQLDPQLDLSVEPSPEPEPAPAPAAAPAPAWRMPTIDAPSAQDEPAPAEAPQVFDFEDDDEGAADGEPEQQPAEAPGGREGSRFSFRYRYEDDE